MKRRKTEWVVMRLSKKKMRDLELDFMWKSSLETNTRHLVYGRFKRVKQKQRVYHMAFKRWLARKQLRGMIVWKDEVYGRHEMD